MCLYTDKRFHKVTPPKRGSNKFPTVSSFVTQCDILVWKRLRPGYGATNGGYSPYQMFLYTFGKLTYSKGHLPKVRSVPLSHYGKDKTAFYLDSARVEAGLHAVTNAKTKYWNSGGTVTYPAVIPKGSRVYFGSRSDIVTNRMIVYKNLAALEKVHGKVSKGIKKLDAVTVN